MWSVVFLWVFFYDYIIEYCMLLIPNQVLNPTPVSVAALRGGFLGGAG
jgi:hypothetical protein